MRQVASAVFALALGGGLACSSASGAAPSSGGSPAPAPTPAASLPPLAFSEGQYVYDYVDSALIAVDGSSSPDTVVTRALISVTLRREMDDWIVSGSVDSLTVRWAQQGVVQQDSNAARGIVEPTSYRRLRHWGAGTDSTTVCNQSRDHVVALLLAVVPVLDLAGRDAWADSTSRRLCREGVPIMTRSSVISRAVAEQTHHQISALTQTVLEGSGVLGVRRIRISGTGRADTRTRVAGGVAELVVGTSSMSLTVESAQRAERLRQTSSFRATLRR